MLERRGPRVEIRPQVVLQVLAHLEDHDPLQGHRLPPALHHQLRLVDVLDQLRVEGPPAPALRLTAPRLAAAGGDEPVGGGDLGEAVALDLREGDGGGEGGAGLGVGRLVGELEGRLNRVLGDPMALEVVGAGAVHLRHFSPEGRESEEEEEEEDKRRRCEIFQSSFFCTAKDLPGVDSVVLRRRYFARNLLIPAAAAAVRFPGELCSGAGDEIRFSYPGAHRPIRGGRERGIHGQEQGGQESYYGGF